MKSPGFSLYEIMSSASEKFEFSLSYLGAFYPSCVIAVARLTEQCLIQGWSEHPHPVCDLSENVVSFSLLSVLITDLRYKSIIVF